MQKRRFGAIASALIFLTTISHAGERMPSKYLTETNRYIAVVENGDLVCEGPDKDVPDILRTVYQPYSDIKFKGDPQSDKAIAILAFPYRFIEPGRQFSGNFVGAITATCLGAKMDGKKNDRWGIQPSAPTDNADPYRMIGPKA